MIKTISLSALALLLPLFSGCKVAPPKPPLVQTLAVLPFDSESNDVDAPEIMQRLVYLALVPSAYHVRDINETNKFLEGKGIVDGGQLAAADPVKIGKDLGVQALVYGNVESFGYTNIGVYVSRKVNLELQVVDVTTGDTLWTGLGKHATRKFGLDKESIKKNLAKGLAKQLTDKVFNNPLAEESKFATRKALATLPGFRFAGFAKDEKTRGKVNKGAQGLIKDIIDAQ